MKTLNLNCLDQRTHEQIDLYIAEYGYTKTIDLLKDMDLLDLAGYIYGLYLFHYYDNAFINCERC